MSVTLRLEDELDVSRGDMIVEAEDQPTVGPRARRDVCWMGDQPLRPGGRYVIKHTTRTRARRSSTSSSTASTSTRSTHEPRRAARASTTSAACALRSSAPLMFDPYRRNRTTGSFILIDEATNDTVGAGHDLRAAPLRAAMAKRSARRAKIRRTA